MEAKLALVRLNQEVISGLYEITEQGDLDRAVADIFAKARAAQIDLWDFALQVTKSEASTQAPDYD